MDIMRPQRVAIVGASESARVAWAPYLGNRNGVDLVIHDVDPAKAHALAAGFGGTAIADRGALVGRRSDIAIISTAPAAHAGAAMALIRQRAVKFLVIERPLAMSLSGARELVEAAEREGIWVYVPYPELVQAEVVIGLIASGCYGEVLSVAYTWADQRESPLGRLQIDGCAHFFALFQALRGWAPFGQESATMVGGGEHLQIAAGSVVDTSQLELRTAVPVRGALSVVVRCTNGTILLSLPNAQTSEGDTGHRVRVISEGRPPVELDAACDVLSAERASRDQVERLLDGRGLPVDGRRALGAQAYGPLAAEAAHTPGMWVSARSMTRGGD